MQGSGSNSIWDMSCRVPPTPCPKSGLVTLWANHLALGSSFFFFIPPHPKANVFTLPRHLGLGISFRKQSCVCCVLALQPFIGPVHPLDDLLSCLSSCHPLCLRLTQLTSCILPKCPRPPFPYPALSSSHFNGVCFGLAEHGSNQPIPPISPIFSCVPHFLMPTGKKWHLSVVEVKFKVVRVSDLRGSCQKCH